MLENSLDDGWLENGGDHFELSTTPSAKIDLDLEHPLEQLSPGHPFSGEFRFFRDLSIRNDFFPNLGMRGQTAVEPGQMHPWDRHQGRQLFQKLFRREEEVFGAIGVRFFHLVDEESIRFSLPLPTPPSSKIS